MSSFKTPKTFHTGGRVTRPSPTPSRAESMMEELGLDDSDLAVSDEDGNSSDGSYDDGVDDIGRAKNAMVSAATVEALRKELKDKNQQREDLLLKVKNYRESSQQLEASYEREKSSKWQQLKILRKTHQLQLEEKQGLVESLQDLIRDQEARILELEAGTNGSSFTANSQSISDRVEHLVDLLNLSQDEMAEAREKQLIAEEELRQSETQSQTQTQQNGHGGGGEHNHTHRPSPREGESKGGWGGSAALEAGLRQQLEQANQIIKNLQEEQKQLGGVTDYEKEVEQLQEEVGKLRDDCSRFQKEAQHQEQVRRRESKSLKQSESEKAQLQKQVAKLEAQMKAKERTLEELSRQQTDSQQLSEGMNKDIERLREETRAQIRELETQLEEKTKQIGELEKYQEKAGLLEEELSRIQGELSQNRLTSAEALTTSKQSHIHEIQKLEAANKASSRRIKELEAQLAKESERLLDSADKQLQTQKSLERKLDEKTEESERLLESTNKQLQTQKSLERRLDEKTEESERLIESAKEQLETQKSLERRLDEKSEELEKVQTEYDQLKANPEIVEVTTEVEVESKEAKKALLQFKLQNNKLSKDLKETKSIQADTAKQLDESKNEVDSLIQKLEEREQEMAEVQHEMEEEMRSLEVTKDQEIDRVKEEAEAETGSILRKYSLMRATFSQLRPGLLRIAQEYQQLRGMCSQFPVLLSQAIQDTKKEIGAKLSTVAKHNEELHKKYQRELALRKKYHNELIDLKGNIRVLARVRPLIKEDGGGPLSKNVVSFDGDDDGILNIVNKGRSSTFEVDRVFNMVSTQEEVFNEVQPIIISSIDGYNVCIFAYGQTGSGKTFTMQGPSSNPGINQRALMLLFEDTAARSDFSFTITVSVMEIYNEMLRDLLSDDPSNKLDVKMSSEGGLYVPGLTEIEVNSVDDVNHVFATGHKNRSTASTDMNEHSSRSHALLCVNIIGKNKTTGKRSIGKLNLVDLAGSERVGKSGSGADQQRLKEAQSINKSLSALGDVIQALRAKQSHIPYRNSKLTYLLQESLGGDSKTLMVVQVSPVAKNAGESHCSLSFAQRVRSVELGAASKRTETSEVAALKERLSQYEDVPASASYSSPARPKTPSKSRTTPRR